eukprot:s2420_g12.t1
MEPKDDGCHLGVKENVSEVRAALARYFDVKEAWFWCWLQEVACRDKQRVDMLSILEHAGGAVGMIMQSSGRCARPALHFKMAIPLRNGFRARVDADCPSLSSWQAFGKAIAPLGIVRAVNAEDLANAEMVCGQLKLWTVGSVAGRGGASNLYDGAKGNHQWLVLFSPSFAGASLQLKRWMLIRGRSWHDIISGLSFLPPLAFEALWRSEIVDAWCRGRSWKGNANFACRVFNLPLTLCRA